MNCRPEAPEIHLGNLNPSSSWLWFDALWWQNSAASILTRVILQSGTPWNVLHLHVVYFWSQLLDQENIGDSGTHLKPPWFLGRVDWYFTAPPHLYLQKIKTSSNLCICSAKWVGQRMRANYQSDYMKPCYHWVFGHGVLLYLSSHFCDVKWDYSLHALSVCLGSIT